MTIQDFTDEFQTSTIREDQINTLLKLVEAVANLRRRVTNLERMASDSLEIKDTTGDYAAGNSWNGRRVLNTFDNTYKIFAEGSWRSILSY